MRTDEDDETSEPGSKLPRVAGSEHQLITMARTLVGESRRYVPTLRNTYKLPEKIGPTAMGLLQQTLARGIARQLIVRGGWQSRRTLVGGRAVRGRLWERHQPLPPLRFGPASFELLAWLVREDVSRPKTELRRHPDTTLGDDLLHYFTMDVLLRAAGQPRAQPAFRLSPLCQLGYPDELEHLGELPKVGFDALVGEHAWVLEALQPELARRWIEIESGKGKIRALDEMIRLGRMQGSVLDRLFAAIEACSPARRDLASFLVEAGHALLRRGPDRRFWTASLDMQASLAARQQAFMGAAALLRALVRLDGWVREAGLVPHFDDDYQAAQLILSNWQFMRERPGTREDNDWQALAAPRRASLSGFERAGLLLRELEELL